MWPGFDGPHIYSRAQWAARVAALPPAASIGWGPPIVVCLHNTSAPTLAQWKESGPSHDQRIANLLDYYTKQGWQHGPHAFVSRSNISGFSDLRQRGTHSTCFNYSHFGVEMVGDYDHEEFDSGDGALVRDNAVFVLATLCRHFGWQPARAIVFHRQCVADNHACPGAKVSAQAVIAKVALLMATPGALA